MPQFEIVVTSDADRDMDEIFSYVSEKLQVPNAASNLIEKIYTALNALTVMPGRFSLSRDAFLAKQGFHVLPVENYLVFYVIDNLNQRVIIHRVIYGKRNYTKLFLADEQS